MPTAAVKKVFNKLGKKSSPSKDYKYHIDYANKDVISGWAIKKDDPTHTVTFEVKSGNTVVMSTKANKFRQDLEDAGLNNGSCAFSDIPNLDAIKSEKGNVDLYLDGIKVSKQSISLYQPESNSTKTGLACYVDTVNVNSVVGWAKDHDDRTRRLRVELKCRDLLIAEGVADQYRYDLDNPEMGDGLYGFKLKPEVGRFPEEEIECDIYLDGEKFNIKPVKLHANKSVIEKERIGAEFSNEIKDLGTSFNEEITRLKAEIELLPVRSKDFDSDLDPAVRVALKNIAELSTRVAVIEKILVDHFSSK